MIQRSRTYRPISQDRIARVSAMLFGGKWSKKHLQGQHDQGKHGHGGTGLASRKMVGTKRTKDGKLKMADGSDLPDHIPKNVPPAWTDVEINPNPKGDLLVKGKDAKGRVQSVYSESHAIRQAEKKFARTNELLSNRESISAEIRKGMSSDDLDTKESAAAMFLISETGLRPGSDRDTKAEKKAFGATNLEARHVNVGENGEVSLKFTGKKGVDLDIPIENSEVANMLVSRKKRVRFGGQPSVSDERFQTARLFKDRRRWSVQAERLPNGGWNVDRDRNGEQRSDTIG
jgi:hypothetical protein